MKYDGITRDSLFLLSDNMFRDSKAFYDEHKEELKSGITVPMRQIAEAIGAELIKLDPLMNTIPTKMVSRIRRDTRFTKDKRLYRENMWIMFMRDKHQWRNYPCFWFEITPAEYTMGIGLFGDDPGVMELLRSRMREDPTGFLKIAKKCESTGAVTTGREYKRIPAGCPTGLEKYYAHKSLGFIKYGGNPDDLASEKIIDIIRSCFKKFSPLYTYLLETADKYFSEGE